MKHLIRKLVNRLGYDVRKIEQAPKPTNHKLECGESLNAPSGGRRFELRSYVGENGDFDYQKYKSIQEDANKQFLDSVWVLEDNIVFLADYLKRSLPSLAFGICHGTRRGDEQRWFGENLQCHVIGTDISETATQFPNSVQWDFHELNPEWEGKADFIYSNALDHSYDPEACLNTWIKTLRIGGLCIIEHSNMHSPEGVTELDPFGADLELMPFLIAKWGSGKYFLKELIDAPSRKDGLRYLSFLVLQRNT
jgi:hypothetical protein